MSARYQEFAYLWDGSDPGWCLVRVGPETRPGHVIFHRGTRRALIIEHDETYGAVLALMVERGVPVFDRLPPPE